MSLQNRIIHIMESSDVDWEKVRKIPIPEYDWKNGSPDEFYNTFVKSPHPVVLRGFYKDSELVNNFSFDQVVERFGEENVILSSQEKDGYLGKLKEIVDPKVYLFNCEMLYSKYPEISRPLMSTKLEPYLRKKIGFAQLFAGRQGTGTPLHNAGTWNFFYMVDGSKKWYFIDPYDYYTAYPMWLASIGAGAFGPKYPDEYNEKLFPAFKYCPYYTTDLQPGDILLNPPWWAHAIRNVTDKTTAVSTRWLTSGKVGTTLTNTEEDYDVCRFGSLMNFTGFKSWNYIQTILYEPCPRFDEHITLREKQGRFSEQMSKIYSGEDVLDGYKIMF